MQYRESLKVTSNPNYGGINCSWWCVQDKRGV